jgi:BirA family biotin operon repressor/biotin-[acetyl-CoA-carboxylase] ligase
MSILLRPTVALDEMPLIGLLASIAVAETVESLGVPQAQLKWPNDVLVEGRKISGILTEARFVGSNFEFLILGIGLNVNSRKRDFPHELSTYVTSLYECAGTTHNVDEIAKDLLKRIEIHYNRALQSGCGFVVPLWMPRWAHLRSRLTRNGLEGIAEDLTPRGALLLRTDEGTLIEITSGDVEPTVSH